MIPPGGTGKLIAKVHTQGRIGQNVKTVTLETSPAGAAPVVLTFKFLVLTPIQITPAPQVNLAGVQGDAIKQELYLRRPDGKPLQLSTPQSSTAGVELTLVKLTEAELAGNNPYNVQPGDWKLSCVLADSSRIRSEAGAVRITTDHPDRKELVLPLQVRLTPTLQVTPPRVELQAGLGKPSSITVDLRHNAYRLFEVTKLELAGDLNGVEVKRVTEQKMMVQRIALSLGETTRLAAGVHQGTLIVSTSIKTLPTIEIPVTVRVVEAAASGSGN